MVFCRMGFFADWSGFSFFRVCIEIGVLGSVFVGGFGFMREGLCGDMGIFFFIVGGCFYLCDRG